MASTLEGYAADHVLRQLRARSAGRAAAAAAAGYGAALPPRAVDGPEYVRYLEGELASREARAAEALALQASAKAEAEASARARARAREEQGAPSSSSVAVASLEEKVLSLARLVRHQHEAGAEHRAALLARVEALEGERAAAAERAARAAAEAVRAALAGEGEALRGHVAEAEAKAGRAAEAARAAAAAAEAVRVTLDERASSVAEARVDARLSAALPRCEGRCRAAADAAARSVAEERCARAAEGHDEGLRALAARLEAIEARVERSSGGAAEVQPARDAATQETELLRAEVRGMAAELRAAMAAAPASQPAPVLEELRALREAHAEEARRSWTRAQATEAVEARLKEQVEALGASVGAAQHRSETNARGVAALMDEVTAMQCASAAAEAVPEAEAEAAEAKAESERERRPRRPPSSGPPTRKGKRAVVRIAEPPEADDTHSGRSYTPSKGSARGRLGNSLRRGTFFGMYSPEEVPVAVKGGGKAAEASASKASTAAVEAPSVAQEVEANEPQVADGVEERLEALGRLGGVALGGERAERLGRLRSLYAELNALRD